jgi:hypothetical protein
MVIIAVLLRYELYEPIKVGEVKTTKTVPIDESELSQRRIVWEYLNKKCILG